MGGPAKAPSAESVRDGGARSSGRLRGMFAVLALAIAAFAITAASASAATEPVVQSVGEVSYSSAVAVGKITSGPGFAFGNWETSSDGGANWQANKSLFYIGPVENEKLEATLSGLKGGTTYQVRLTVLGVNSPGPNVEFTTLHVDPPENVTINAPAVVFSLSAELSGKLKRPANSDSAFDVECRYEYISEAQFEENVTNIGAGAGFTGAAQAPCEPSPVTEPGVEKTVTAKLTGLTAATTYHQRLVAENGSPEVITKVGPNFTTLPTVEKPKALSLGAVTDVSYRSAKISGEIERPAGADPALNTFCFFEVVTEEQFQATGFESAGRYICDQISRNPFNEEPEPIAQAGPLPVTATLRLNSGVTYHVRLGVENAGGTDSSSTADTFTTIPGGEPEPTVEPAKAIAGYTSIKLFGNVKYGLGAEDELIGYAFEWAEVGTENWSGCCETLQIVPHGPGLHAVSFEFNKSRGIKPATEYKYRLVLQAREGAVYFSTPEPYPTVTTRPLASPTATLDPISEITGTGARFSGTIDTNAPAGPLDDLGKAAYKTNWEFVCTPECPGPGGNPLGGVVQGEEGSQPISIDTKRLIANTYYEVKLLAHNDFYAVETPLETFQTPLILPDVKSEAGASDGEGGYFLEGVVNSNNSKVTSCTFEYGTTAAYPNSYQAPCLPSPSGPDEVQNINIEATEGQFKLSFRGQTTADLPFNATTAEVQTALRALSQVGPAGVNVAGSPQAYVVTFAGKLAGANVEPIKASDGTTPLGGGGGAGISTATEGGINHPVAVEVHVQNLTIGVHYHFRIFATNAAGKASSVDREFIPTLAEKGPPCPNEAIRNENSSFALPECRAYEMVTPPDKQGYGATFLDYNAGADVAYTSKAGNIANSGFGGIINFYTATRTDAGWQTPANLDGPSGADASGPNYVTVDTGGLPILSKDLLSAVWTGYKESNPGQAYVRKADGSFVLLGKAIEGGASVFALSENYVGASDDFSHLVFTGTHLVWGTLWGSGVYEFVGTAEDQPRRVDVDNSGNPVAHCGGPGRPDAVGRAISSDGRVIVFTAVGDCGSANPPANELWARVGGTTSYDLAASECDRTAADPGGVCNGPIGSEECSTNPYDSGSELGPGCRNLTFQGASADGSRTFFTTAQQLVNGDVDQTNDLYACDIPPGNPTPVGEGNPCSALSQISVAETGAAEVENVLGNSEDGSTVLFTAKGVLAANEDGFGERALAGDHNLYVWRQDSSHPAGQTSFVGRLTSGAAGQITPDGRYLALDTTTPLLSNDTDTENDVYRYDVETGQLTRASTGSTGSGGNASFNADFAGAAFSRISSPNTTCTTPSPTTARRSSSTPPRRFRLSTATANPTSTSGRRAR